MTEIKLELTALGTHWPWGGTLFVATHPGGREARVYVDDLGETWVDVRRVPEGGHFHTERVECYRAFAGAIIAQRDLQEQGYDRFRRDRYSHRVRERPIEDVIETLAQYVRAEGDAAASKGKLAVEHDDIESQGIALGAQAQCLRVLRMIENLRTAYAVQSD